MASEQLPNPPTQNIHTPEGRLRKLHWLQWEQVEIGEEELCRIVLNAEPDCTSKNPKIHVRITYQAALRCSGTDVVVLDELTLVRAQKPDSNLSDNITN